MTGERTRIEAVLDKSYVYEVGLALLCLARLEWEVGHCCNMLQPGYLNRVERNGTGAKEIAQKFIALIGSQSDRGL